MKFPKIPNVNVPAAAFAAYLVLAAFVMAALALLVFMREGQSGADLGGAMLLAVAFTFLFSPHYSWYFAWLLPFATLLRSVALLWLPLASLLLYLLPAGPVLARHGDRTLIESLVYLPFVILAALELWHRARPEAAER